MAEYQSGKGSLARRVSQGRAILTLLSFLFFPLSTCLLNPHQYYASHRDYAAQVEKRFALSCGLRITN